MTNPTAAQPLDLDKQRALFEAVERDSSSNLKRQADGQYENPCTQSAWEGWQNALITQARAAQPAESIDQPIGHLSPAIGQPDAAICQPQGATGTTGAAELSDAGIVEVLASMGVDSEPSKFGFKELQVRTTVPTIRKVVERYFAAPASAQPADVDAERYRKVRAALSKAYFDYYQAENASDAEIDAQVDEMPAAQPDRGAAAPVYAVGASASIDGIADELEAEALNYEGDFADTVKGCVEALREIAASPATQPVAPADIALELLHYPSDDGHILVRLDDVKEILARRAAAVAPSDAKGKADAANAGGLAFRERFADAYLSLSVAHFNSPFWNQSMEQLLAAVDVEINKRVAERGQSPATSAADAKDATPVISSYDIEKVKKLKYQFVESLINSGVQYRTCGAISAALNRIIDGSEGAAMAAAPSSELATLTDEIDRLERKLKNTPLRYSSGRFDIAMEIDKLKAKRDKAAAPSSAAGTEGGNHG